MPGGEGVGTFAAVGTNSVETIAGDARIRILD